MLRIITGSKKGKRIEVPESARPITDRIRTSIFDTIAPVIKGAAVLDLYSGSGAFGLEALSRDAYLAHFVENNRVAVETITQNVKNLGFESQSEIKRQDVEEYISSSTNIFDIIMFDPPFKVSATDKFKLLTKTSKLLAKQGVLIFRYPETEKYATIIPGIVLLHSKKFGLSIVNYYQKV